MQMAEAWDLRVILHSKGVDTVSGTWLGTESQSTVCGTSWAPSVLWTAWTVQ